MQNADTGLKIIPRPSFPQCTVPADKISDRLRWQFYPGIIMAVRIGAKDQKGSTDNLHNFRTGFYSYNSSRFPPLQKAAIANLDLYQFMG